MYVHVCSYNQAVSINRLYVENNDEIHARGKKLKKRESFFFFLIW